MIFINLSPCVVPASGDSGGHSRPLTATPFPHPPIIAPPPELAARSLRGRRGWRRRGSPSPSLHLAGAAAAGVEGAHRRASGGSTGGSGEARFGAPRQDPVSVVSNLTCGWPPAKAWQAMAPASQRGRRERDETGRGWGSAGMGAATGRCCAARA
jgi:hypothetical protein